MDDAPIPSEQVPVPPFVGRVQAFARLQHHLNSPTEVPPVVFLGRQYTGKSALLHQFQASAHSDTIAVYIPLKHIQIDGEAGWLHTLSQLIAETISSQGYASAAVEPFPEDTGTFREWFAEIYLPSLFRLIRPHRRLVLLLDDAELLLLAVMNKKLPSDTFAYLHHLLHPQLGMALTIHVLYESDLDRLTPLVNISAVHRLTNLTLEAISQYSESLTEPTYTEDAVLAIHQLTGGEAILLQKVLQLAARQDKEKLTAEDIKLIGGEVYQLMKDFFREVWEDLRRDERLVLTAVGGLIYTNPLQQIDTNRIESWLIETDYPLDATAINAVIRSLEYREVLDGVANNVRIKSGLMQKWLLENALLEDTPAVETATNPNPRLWLMIGALLIVVAIALILAINTGSTSGENPTPLEPTITLIPGN